MAIQTKRISTYVRAPRRTQHPKLDQQTAQAAARGELRAGATGAVVKNVQKRLGGANLKVPVTGVLDERTLDALRRFQQREKLPVTGMIDKKTWAVLRQSILYARGPFNPPPRLGERSSVVLQAERLMKKLKLNPGKVDGVFDRKTLLASRKFENSTTRAGRDGAIDAAQMQQMRDRARGGITAGQLRAIMPSLSPQKARFYLPYLNRAMVRGGLTTRMRQAAFLAQLAHESVELKYWHEIGRGGGRHGIYYGRGPIQITWQSNYAAAGRALGLPLVSKPDLASRPEHGFDVAVWFWNSRGLSRHADRGNFDYTTYRINGAYNAPTTHAARRRAYYKKALSALKT